MNQGLNRLPCLNRPGCHLAQLRPSRTQYHKQYLRLDHTQMEHSDVTTARRGASTVLRLDKRLFGVVPLPRAVRDRWAGGKENTVKEFRLDDIVARLQSAEAKRQALLEDVVNRARQHSQTGRAPSLTCDRTAEAIQDKLATAQAKRQGSLAEKRAKAASMLQRAEEAAARLDARKAQLEAKIRIDLAAAEARRASARAQASARRSQAWEGWQGRLADLQARQASEAAARRAALEGRLQRAAGGRREGLQAAVAASRPQGLADPFLTRRALSRALLRRQASARRLQRAWLTFKATHGTTQQLAAAFAATHVSPIATAVTQQAQDPAASSEPGLARTASVPVPALAVMGVRTGLVGDDSTAPTPDSFQRFATALESPATVRAAQALLRRLDTKLRITAPGTSRAAAPLLRRLFPRTARAGSPLERFPPRVFLCAYMLRHHPQVVLSRRGEREEVLMASARNMLAAFEQLLAHLLEPPTPATNLDSQPLHTHGPTARLLVDFDGAWLAYLKQFVAWKFEDAASLEGDLVRMAAELESSMLLKLGGHALDSARVQASPDLQAVVEQVRRDHALLAERVQRLGGAQGTARLQAAIAAARAAVAAALQAEASAPASPRTGAGKQSPVPPGTPPRTAPRAAMATPPASPVPASPPSASPGTPPDAATSDGGVQNEDLVWQLLYDLQWQLPTTETQAAWDDAAGKTNVMQEGTPDLSSLPPAAAAVAVQSRIRRVAETAFWDSVKDRLASTAASPDQATVAAVGSQLASLLAGLGQELLGVLPGAESGGAATRELRRELEGMLEEGCLREALDMGNQAAGLAGIDTAHLMAVLERTAVLVRNLGAPVREADSLAAHAQLRQRLGAALGMPAGPEARSELAGAVTAALRLLAAQLRLLRVDSANARLRALAATLQSGAGISYARDKFAAQHGLSPVASPQGLAASLPHTRAWLALASGQLPAVEQAVQGLPVAAAGAARGSQRGVPQAMRSGLRAMAAPAPAAQGPRPAAVLVAPVAPRSWRGLVRLGLTALAAGETDVAASPALAETLRRDAGRLHAVQNALQQLLVLSACMLLVQQARAGSNSQPMTATEVAAAKQRLVAILADQAMRLTDIAAELARLAAGPQGAAEVGAEAEAGMAAGLQRMLTRSSGAFKALSGGIVSALHVHLLLRPGHSDAAAQQAIAAALGRAGAGTLRAEVAQLAEQLSAVAAVTEAVHGHMYEQLSADLL